MLAANPTAPVQPARQPEILALTALRGIAAWWVALYHLNGVVAWPAPFQAVLNQGTLAVELFFIMSGFVLGRQYLLHFAGGVGGRRYWWFIGIRLARVYPLHLVMMMTFLALPLTLHLSGRPPVPTYAWWDFWCGLFLVQDWGFSAGLRWNTPSWSISAELFFYLLFPFLAFGVAKLSRNAGWMWALAGALLLANALNGWYWGGLLAHEGRAGVIICCLGAGLGLWLAPTSIRHDMTEWRSWVLLTLAGLLIEARVGGVADYLVMPAAFTLLIWAMLDGSNALARLLSTRVLLWLGQVSYSTYLTHYFVRGWLRLALVDRVPGWMVMSLYIGLVLALSVLAYRLIEVPGRRIGRRYADRIIARAPGRSHPIPAVAGGHGA